jgi:Protein of unknown function (DUF2911)
MRTLAICMILVSPLTLRGGAQQAPSSGKLAEVVCTFDDGKQMKVEYSDSIPKHGEEFHIGRVWEPGGSPVFLFTQTALIFGSSEIPPGAYSLYVIPGKQNWTLVVNRNAAVAGKYDEKQDLVRVPMGLGETGSPVKPAQIAFDHLGPKQCNLRVYYEKTGAWTEVHEK